MHVRYVSTFIPFDAITIYNKSSAVAEMGDRGHNKHGPKRGGLLCPFREGARSLSNTLWSGPMSTSIQSDAFIYPAVWSQQTWTKIGRGCAFFSGKARSPSNTKSPGPRPTSIPSGILVHPTVWSQRTLAENWGLYLFRRGGAGYPSNTMSPRLRPTSVPRGILIHTAVSPQ